MVSKIRFRSEPILPNHIEVSVRTEGEHSVSDMSTEPQERYKACKVNVNADVGGGPGR